MTCEFTSSVITRLDGAVTAVQPWQCDASWKVECDVIVEFNTPVTTLSTSTISHIVHHGKHHRFIIGLLFTANPLYRPQTRRVSRRFSRLRRRPPRSSRRLVSVSCCGWDVEVWPMECGVSPLRFSSATLPPMRCEDQGDWNGGGSGDRD
jgi:hypothetical protein